MTKEQLARNIVTMEDGEIDLFLGAGASVSSGIPSGGDLIWYFKRLIYCNENGILPEKYKDLHLESTRNLLQNYFDSKNTYPVRNDPAEYSHYFQECYPLPLARQRFIDEQVSRRNPSLGYLCLADLVCKEKLKNIWTTNFDSLVETALNIIEPTKDYLVCSSANSSSIPYLNPTKPCICKLHGDFRYDTLQNTSDELKSLEEKIYNYCLKSFANKGLVVIGYSGNDDSVMSFFESHIHETDFLSKGIFWTKIKGGNVSSRVEAFIAKAKELGKVAEIVEINGFDTFLYGIYGISGQPNTLIDDQWKISLGAKSKLKFDQNPTESFVKLNAYRVYSNPICKVFNTDIKNWKQLRSITENERITAALFNGCIYSFDDTEALLKVFGEHIKSDVFEEEVDARLIRHHDSIYIGLLYDLISQHMEDLGFVSYGRHKYYDPKSCRSENGLLIYESVEISLEYAEPHLYLCLVPTVHILSKKGNQLPKLDYQYQINKYTSKVFNKEYNEKLKIWQSKFYKSGFLEFRYKNTSLKFVTPAVSCGGTNRDREWIEFPAYEFEEPIMCFSEHEEKNCINQLKGLVNYGPIDSSYVINQSVRSPIKLAILSPRECLSEILKHLNRLNQSLTPKSDAFLPQYESFASIYRKEIIVPDASNFDLCKTYSVNAFDNKPVKDFVNFIKRGIDFFSKNVFTFDILVIYIPKVFERFRESKDISPDFNLHDAIKLYATEKGVTVQFIEERSTNTYDPCKVLWGLSTSLYAKSQGVLWHPKEISENTVYIGIGYAQSEKNGICIGCSQLFDSTGTGVRMILRKIENPLYAGKRNPYMRKEEAREMMSALREKYYHCCPTSIIKRVVIHKTTPFMKDEIIGITQAFEGVDIDLIQIQEHTSWRGIRFGMVAQKEAYGYALKRGTTIKLNNESFLLWSHGCVMSDELSGVNRNYYKNGRGIPAPLLVKKHYGQANGDIIAKEILMLTKMNWNSGDSLYKMLPVTLDFAKILSRMSKQDEAIYDKAYDFRYFM